MSETKTLQEALLQIQSKAIVVKKESKGYNYTYADLEAVWGACREAVNKAGVLVHQAVQETYVSTNLSKGDDVLTTKVPLLLPENATMKQLGSAITYARRYGLVTALGIITEDDDGQQASDLQTNPPVTIKSDESATDKQKKAILALVKQKGQIEDFEIVKSVTYELFDDVDSLTLKQASDIIGELKAMTPEEFKQRSDMDQDPKEPSNQSNVGSTTK